MEITNRQESSQNAQAATFNTIILFILTLVLAKLIQSWYNRKNFPPGPCGYPILGHLPMLGKTPFLYFEKLSKKYGNIVSIQMGSRDCVIINGYEACRQALVSQAEIFAGRPDFESFQYISGGNSIPFRNYDNCWKLHRKIAANALRKFTLSKTEYMNDLIIYQGKELVNKLFKKQICDFPCKEVKETVANILLAECFGKREDCNSNKDYSALCSTDNKFNKYQGAGGNLGDLFPWYSTITCGAGLKKFREFQTIFQALCKKQINEHLETFNKNNLRDVIDALILGAKETKDETKLAVGLTDDAIILSVESLLGPGRTTVSNFISWATLYMAGNPRVQAKVQFEIDTVLGKDAVYENIDINRMPFVQATIFEILRCACIVPQFPHSTTKDTVFYGFTIKQGTLVFPNFWSVTRDISLWRNPNDFDPGRFLSTDGKDFLKDKAELVPAFGWGKRRCIGEQFAKIEIFLLFVILFQKCTFMPIEDSNLDFEPVFSLLLHPKHYKVQCLKRVF